MTGLLGSRHIDAPGRNHASAVEEQQNNPRPTAEVQCSVAVSAVRRVRFQCCWHVLLRLASTQEQTDGLLNTSPHIARSQLERLFTTAGRQRG